MRQKIIYIICFLIMLLTDIQANDLNITGFGKLFVTNFSPGMYQGGNQNWNICAGGNGLMYIANGSLLEGGSDFWKIYPLSADADIGIRSVARLGENSILIGANQEIGIFERSGIPGYTSYTSLMDKLDDNFHSFGSVWQIIEKDSCYYLRAGKGVFKYDRDTIVPILFGDITDYIYLYRDQLLVLISGKGLGLYTQEGFQLLPFGNFFSDKRIVSITPHGEDEILIFTDDEGVFRANLETIRSFNILNIGEIIESQISRAILMDGNYYAIGTTKNGLYILDTNGRIIQHLNNKNGLQNNTIISMYEDQSKNLWLGLDYGISYVYLNSCLSIVNSESDVGTGYVSMLYKDRLYLGTNQGLFYMDWKSGGKKQMGDMEIYPVKNTSGQVWNLQIFDNILYCSHHKGLFRIEEDRGIIVSSLEGSWQIDTLMNLPGYMLQSTYRGFYLYKINSDGDLSLVNRVEKMESSRLFWQDLSGNIWNVTPDNKIFRYVFNRKNLSISEKFEYSGENGFKGNKVRIVGNDGYVLFTTHDGIYYYDNLNGYFKKNEFYDEILFDDELLVEFFQDDYDRIWYVSESRIGYFSLDLGKMENITRPFNLVANSYTYFLGKINVIDRDNILFGIDRGFYHYNAACSSLPGKSYHSYIIDLKTFSPPVKTRNMLRKKDYPLYPHKKNSFEFVFSSNIIESQEKVRFKFKLEGYDDDWSEWNYRNTKEYNNLFEGVYTLYVKAMDASGIESDISSFSFQVKPPPYRSISAYMIYIFLFLIISFFLRKYRLKKLENEKQKIEIRKQKELEEKKKKYEEEQLISKQKITELQNDRLHQDLKHKAKELSNSMLNILHKNEILLNLKKEMQSLYLEKNLTKRDYNIKRLMRMIDNEISTKKDLELFDTNFNAVHEEFINNLREKYPDLNQNDHRLCTFIKMNKSTKEIATFLNMSIRGVETSRYRLRKKMELDSEANLYDIISNI